MQVVAGLDSEKWAKWVRGELGIDQWRMSHRLAADATTERRLLFCVPPDGI
jgi:hypothetical protein